MGNILYVSKQSEETNKKEESMSCQFFVKNGYCTLGTNCKLYHVINNNEREEKDEEEYANITEIAFSFDTTGSMTACIDTVRSELRQIIKKLFCEISNIRIALIAHGDYNTSPYVVKHIDFTRDGHELIEFINNAHKARGCGDNGECYEYVLWTANNKLNWTQNAKSKALVIIGDDQPHTVNFPGNTKKIDWKKEIEVLKQDRITCFGIHCGDRGEHYQHFYKEISKRTNGRYLKLLNMKNITKLFVALCLKTSDDDELFEKYKNEILRSDEGDDEIKKAIMSLSGMQTGAKNKKIKIKSSIKRLMYDLKEIKREKLIDIAVVPEEENVFKWHVNIKPIQGIFRKVYIHLTMQFPSNYPDKAPSIKLITKFPNSIHQNISHNIVCLPLFGANNYNARKSKYGSSWSAAYSIISLLVNISSIFTEIDMENNNNNKLLECIRKTSCNQCGHSHNTPYPVLESNKLPFDIIEINLNEQHYKNMLEIAIKNGDKEKQKKIIKQEKKNRIRGVLIVGNIIETIKDGIFWKIKSKKCVNRNYHKAVAWTFIVDMLKEKKSDFIFGFVNDMDAFFGVGMNGNVVFNNNNNYDRNINININIKIKQHDIITYILNLNDKRDELFIFVNYNLISSVNLPALYIKCNNLYPVMYVKDIRIHLTLNIDPKLNEMINNKYSFDKIEVFNKLQSTQNYVFNIDEQKKWNKLLEVALSGDILLSIFGYLSYSDLIHCHEVNTYWYSILNGYNILNKVEMRCFYTHESINKCILGVGLNVIYSSNNWIKSVETEMDLLSFNAYKDYNINKGAWGEKITHFLPLIINKKHSKNAKKCLLDRLAKICNANKFNISDGLMVITAIMNQFVVQLMANTVGLNENVEKIEKIDPKHASEKALIGYCAFHHMLLYLIKQYPQIKQIAKESIKKFIENESYREKSTTSDLGKFLLNLAIIDDYNWKDIAIPFIHESLDRNVKWYLQKYPKLKYLDDSKCSIKERIDYTLKATIISRRLIRFQVFFINNICQQNGHSMNDIFCNYNKRWGQPTKQQKKLLIKEVNNIISENDNINSWLQFFDIMGIKKYKTNQQIVKALKNAVINSKNKGYHREYHDNRKQIKRNVSSINSDITDITDSDIIEMDGELIGHND